MLRVLRQTTADGLFLYTMFKRATGGTIVLVRVYLVVLPPRALTPWLPAQAHALPTLSFVDDSDSVSGLTAGQTCCKSAARCPLANNAR